MVEKSLLLDSKEFWNLMTLCYSRRELLLYAGDSREVDEEAKEWEHKLLQNSMDKELHELNRRLEEKEVSFTCYLCTRVL